MDLAKRHCSTHAYNQATGTADEAQLPGKAGQGQDKRGRAGQGQERGRGRAEQEGQGREGVGKGRMLPFGGRQTRYQGPIVSACQLTLKRLL